MDFGDLLHFAQKNENASTGNSYYRARFDPPKKEKKQTTNLSSNIQKFLAQKEDEERRKAEQTDEKRRQLLSMRNPKDKRKIEKMLKVIKSANKSVLSDTLEDQTAITASGPSQPDEDDYGYESQVAADLYKKIMSKYSKMPVEEKFPTSARGTVKDLGNTKDRVRAAIEREREIENDPHLRRLKRKEARLALLGGETTTIETTFDNDDSIEDTSLSNNYSAKEEKKRRPAAPPPLDFQELLRLAEQKRNEPVSMPSVKEGRSASNFRDDEPVPPRPMTAKERRAWLEEQERLKRRALRDMQAKKGHRPSPPPSNNTTESAPMRSDKPKPFSIPKISKKADGQRQQTIKTLDRPAQLQQPIKSLDRCAQLPKQDKTPDKNVHEQSVRKQSDKRHDSPNISDRNKSNRDEYVDRSRLERLKTVSSKELSDRIRTDHRVQHSDEKISKSKTLFDSPKHSLMTSVQKEEPTRKDHSTAVLNHSRQHSSMTSVQKGELTRKDHSTAVLNHSRQHSRSNENLKERHKDLFTKEQSSSSSSKHKHNTVSSKSNMRLEERNIPKSTNLAKSNGLQSHTSYGNKYPNSNANDKNKDGRPTMVKGSYTEKVNQPPQKRPEVERESHKPVKYKTSDEHRPIMKKYSEGNSSAMSKFSEGNRPAISKSLQGNRPVMSKSLEGNRPVISKSLEGNRPVMSKSLQGNRPVMTKSLEGNRPVMSKSLEGHRPVMNKSLEGNRPVMSKSIEGNRPIMSKSLEGNRPVMSKSLEGNRPVMKESSKANRPVMNETSKGHNPVMSKSFEGNRPAVKKSLEAHRPVINKPSVGNNSAVKKFSEDKRTVMHKTSNANGPMGSPAPRQFPPLDIKKAKKPVKRRIDSESEKDSELDDFIDDDDDGEDYSSYIKEIFGYDKSKYSHIDEDDSNMESNFAQQMREEYISKKIGIMEDLEDMRLEAEEKKRKSGKKVKK